MPGRCTSHECTKSANLIVGPSHGDTDVVIHTSTTDICQAFCFSKYESTLQRRAVMRGPLYSQGKRGTEMDAQVAPARRDLK